MGYTSFIPRNIKTRNSIINYASNLCAAVGGDQNKEFRGNASFLREKGLRDGIKIHCYCIFHIDQKAKIICKLEMQHHIRLLSFLTLQLQWGQAGFVYIPPRVQNTICVYLSCMLCPLVYKRNIPLLNF